MYPMNISIPAFDKVLDFIVKSGCNSLQLAGDKLTIHPKFNEILIKI